MANRKPEPWESGAADRTWDRYVMRRSRDDRWVLKFGGQLDLVKPPADPRGE
jgi:hypothetical protein